MEANDLHSRIQANLQQLSTLEKKPHYVKDGPVTASMHYNFNEEEVGKINLLKSRSIIFRSELDRAVPYSTNRLRHCSNQVLLSQIVQFLKSSNLPL